jgi:hypothetical protein
MGLNFLLVGERGGGSRATVTENPFARDEFEAAHSVLRVDPSGLDLTGLQSRIKLLYLRLRFNLN